MGKAFLNDFKSMISVIFFSCIKREFVCVDYDQLLQILGYLLQTDWKMTPSHNRFFETTNIGMMGAIYGL